MRITGKVVDRRATLPVVFRLPGLADVQIECVVDTGFSGVITLPAAAIIAMGLTYLEDRHINLANDTDIVLPVYVGNIIWHGVERSIRVLASGRQPLIGVALLFDNLLGIDFVDAGIVTVQRRL